MLERPVGQAAVAGEPWGAAADDTGGSAGVRDAGSGSAGRSVGVPEAGSGSAGGSAGVRDAGSGSAGRSAGVREAGSGSAGGSAGVRDAGSGSAGRSAGVRDAGSGSVGRSAGVPEAGSGSAGRSAGVPDAGSSSTRLPEGASASPAHPEVPEVPEVAEVPDALPSASVPHGSGEPGAPLHAPDRYSTPPYGEPGPWALAPPVQHPTATPAQGTAVAPALPQQQTGSAGVPGPPTPGAAHGASPVAEHPSPHPTAHFAPPSGPADPWGRYDPWAAPRPSGPLQQAGAAVPGEGQRRRRARGVLIAGAVALALVSGGIGGAVGTYLERGGGVGEVVLPQAGKESAERAPDTVAGIAARALPSVVTLHVSGGEEAGTGTGFVLDGSGHILTNNHVVEPAGDDGEITVTFNSGDTAQAEVIGSDGGYDLAVVKVTAVKGLQPAPLGNSENVQVGDPVVAIGAPFDLSGTVTSGIISATERPITAGGEADGTDISYVDALQTDAPINPGNSGGPLLDSRGRVIGINSAIRSAGSGSELDGGQAGSIGLGFAIPINQGKRVAEELINTGRATHPVIGVTLDMNYSGDGARVGTETSDGGSPVTEGGPGDQAGIEPGDVITEIDGQRVHSGEELIVKTRSHRPGDRLELKLLRDGEERTLSLVLGSSDGS
ncbi:trypsin-like peptidase domain-containing protein [Streptomyces sp. NPDC004610]|uniref:trypsin-like peptidase domain-containing protein n=1 Tax=unclassified Streptomyces TaxID=2593676 RepID=UPI0033B676A5